VAGGGGEATTPQQIPAGPPAEGAAEAGAYFARLRALVGG